MKVVHEPDVSAEDTADEVSGRGYSVSPAEEGTEEDDGTAGWLAAVGLINPLLAAAAMASSSVLVVANSTRSYGIEDG